MNLKRILLNNSLVRSFSVSSNVKNEANKVDEKFQQISRERTLNLVQIIGRVGHNPKVAGQSEKNEPNKKFKRVVLFSMATNEYQGMNEDGEAKFRTDWHRITLISPRLQEYALDKVSQGDRLHITGRLHYDLVKNKSGEPRLITNIVADDFIFLQKFNEN
ncbi:Single-stranded DNA-binding mitochondrial [Brachionus plicatilis]|uniref:Single-stranded DNA-binding mitochondrial n=1 Tax=Brachionus plicatilis TaxID=10195 RepID=A0A3M7P5G5_BRAPC|nr:Single-stranded DNA-binding mitochondrial [Brachionus plicatilis]